MLISNYFSVVECFVVEVNYHFSIDLFFLSFLFFFINPILLGDITSEVERNGSNR